MKLFVINGENSGKKVQIEIGEFSYVNSIKFELHKIQANEKFSKNYFRLIYKNIILNNDDFIKWYKICENDEIWFGKIENYLKKDDVIVEVFLAGWIPDFIWLIVKINDSISTIRSIIERIQSKIINIWDWKGHEMRNNQIITEIDTSGYYRLIVSCEGKEINLAFEECCNQHDLFRMKLNNSFGLDIFLIQYFFSRGVSETIKVRLLIQMNEIRQIISSKNETDARLNENLSNFPTSFFNSNYLFCHDIYERILDIFHEIWFLTEDACVCDDIYETLPYFNISLLTILRIYFDTRRDHPENVDRSFYVILIDTLHYYISHLNDTGDEFKCTVKLLMDPFLISHSRIVLDGLIYKNPYLSIPFAGIRINGKLCTLPFNSRPRTVNEAKAEISYKMKFSEQDLYCINTDIDDKPTNEHPFNRAFLMFELMKNIENFDFVKELASGAFGKVFIYQDKISRKQFVIKKAFDVKCSLHRDIFINNKILNSKELFKHSGIVKDQNFIHLSMEYMTGGSLTNYIKQGKCQQEKEILEISYQILKQINALHNSQIIHRDIKPDNVVLDGEGNPKLIDLGLAKSTSKLTNEDLLEKLKVYAPGTINYMAPELIKENPYSYKIDIWSFGMVMVEMVTGNPPFHRKNIFRIISELKIMQNYKFKPIIPISNNLENFINSCLTGNPDLRPTGKQLMESQLFIDYVHSINK